MSSMSTMNSWAMMTFQKLAPQNGPGKSMAQFRPIFWRGMRADGAALMDARKIRIGEHAAELALPWAVNALGHVPRTWRGQRDWQQRAVLRTSSLARPSAMPSGAERT